MSLNVNYEVKILIVNSNGEVLLGRRKTNNKNDFFHKSAYVIPTGVEKYDESTFECAERVVKDKTNLDLVKEKTHSITSVKGNYSKELLTTIYLYSEEPIGEVVNFDDDVLCWEWINIDMLNEIDDNLDYLKTCDFLKKKVLH